MAKVSMFKSKNKTNRFNKNQKVWVRRDFANHLVVWFKWRGSGRYVSGNVDKFSPEVGEIKIMDVDDTFADRVMGKTE